MNNKQQFDREWGNAASIEFYPQRTIVIEWWKKATEIGDWFVCATLLRGAAIHCPDVCLDDYSLLIKIARSRIQKEPKDSYFLLYRCREHNRRMRVALEKGETALLSAGCNKAADECRQAIEFCGGDHEL